MKTNISLEGTGMGAASESKGSLREEVAVEALRKWGLEKVAICTSAQGYQAVTGMMSSYFAERDIEGIKRALEPVADVRDILIQWTPKGLLVEVEIW
jgi:hypothetical protein